MNVDDYVERMKEATHMDIERLKEMDKPQPEEEPAPEPVDMYQEMVNHRNDYATKQVPKGSSQIVGIAVASVIDGNGGEGLKRAYQRAKDDSELLKSRGERNKIAMRRQQYLEEYFLPAVEIVVNSTSPDEVLNSEKALNELDKYASLEGSGKGYTASYIRQAYGNQLGQVEGRSDASVQDGLRRINMLLDNGEVRTAVGIANQLKGQIDSGKAMADDIDYDTIGRIVAYYH